MVQYEKAHIPYVYIYKLNDSVHDYRLAKTCGESLSTA